MIEPGTPLALYMEGAMKEITGKMGFGVLRYSPHPITCVIDRAHAGQDARDVTGIPRSAPIVASVQDALRLGARALVLGIAPPGGQIPSEWLPPLDEAVACGLSLINGLHNRLAPRYPHLAPGQFVWDIRVEPEGLGVATAAARELRGKRLLLIGTDMSVGKMTAGLEIHSEALRRGMDSAFVATGQVGITITGSGVPLDAVRVDYASGSVEREVLRTPDAELIVVEGQGSLLHPGSTATLPLLRGSCPTHLIVCCRAGQTHLRRVPWVEIPPLRPFAHLYEDLAEACGTYRRPRTVAVALNSFEVSAAEAGEWVQRIEAETGWPCADPVRHGAGKLLDAVLAE